jgi:radical SAM superfamily enzyme YgiQ (UPF0313 family)
MYKRVAIITFPSQELERPPAAVAALGGVCIQQGVEYDVFDLNLASFNTLSKEDYAQCELHWRVDSTVQLPQSMLDLMDSTIEKIITGNFDLIAISVFSKFSTRAARLFCERIRPLTNTIIVAGGQGLSTPYGTTQFGRYLEQQQLVNHTAWGDGELIWQNWLRGDFSVPGTDYIVPEQIQDLEALPLPDFSKVNPNHYHYSSAPGMYITASRGCVRQCQFCDVPSRWPKYKYRKGESVADELYHHYKNTGVVTFQFTDSVINGNLKEFLKMQQRLADLREQDPDFKIQWLSQFNIRKKKDMPEVYYETMRRAGAEVLVVGVEHASWTVRQSMGKEFDDDDLDYHIKMCAKHGIKNVFLMFVGYPSETLEDHQKQIDFLKTYQKYMLSGTIMVIRWGYTGSIDHGSKLEIKGLGTFVPEWPELRLDHVNDQDQDWLYGRNWINLDNPTLTLKERLRRRLEVQEESYRLGWPVTRSKEELDILHIIADQIMGEKKTIPIHVELSDH